MKEYRTLPKQIHNRYQIQEGFAARERIMGNLALRQGKVEQAQAHLVASLDRRTRLTKRSSDPAAKIQLAESHVELGDFYFLQRADFLSAMKHYTEAESIHSELAKADPKHLPTQRHLSLVWYRLGTVYLHRSWTGSASIAGFWRIASRHWYLKCLGARKRLSQMDKTDVRAKYELAIIQARCGDHPSAVAFADGVLPSIKKDPSTLFQVACIYSLSSGVGKMSSNHYKSQAFQVLDQMSQLGWKDPVTLKSDPDLIYLQSDSRFDKLLRMLSGEKN